MGSDLSMYAANWRPRSERVFLNRNGRWEVYRDSMNGWKRVAPSLPDTSDLRLFFERMDWVVVEERPLKP